MSVVYKTGNLFSSDAQVFGHGVNTVGVMGAGIAKTFKEMFPKNYRAYQKACSEGFSPGGSLLVQEGGRYIANISSQDLPGPNADLRWLKNGLLSTLLTMNTLGLNSVALPRIGAGIGGLDYHDVKSTIEEVSEEFPEITVEVWELPHS